MICECRISIYWINRSLISGTHRNIKQTIQYFFRMLMDLPSLLILTYYNGEASFLVGISLSTNKINAVRKRVMYMEHVWIYLYIYMICIDIQKKKVAYKIFDSKITTFLLKLEAISFFTYEQSTTYIKSIWFHTHLSRERIFQSTILYIEQKTDVKFFVA